MTGFARSAGGPGRRENTPLGCFLTRLPFKSCQIKNNAGSLEPALFLCYLFEKDAPKTKSKPSGAGSILKGEMPRIFKQCRLRRCDRIRGISTLVRVTGFEPAASCSQTAARTRCYMCMNYIWRCLVRKTCSPALFSPLYPRPPKAVVVKHVVVPKTLPWNAADLPSPGSVWIVALFHRKVK